MDTRYQNPNLTGTIYIRNAIKYDYCVEEAIRSIAPICKEVICLECRSEDDTLALLDKLQGEIPNLHVIPDIDWDMATKYDRLRALSDYALEHVQTEWRLHIQADEVLHERSYISVRNIVRGNIDPIHAKDSYRFTRINLFGNFDLYIDPQAKSRPCGHDIIRLAKRHIKSCGDDESLNDPNTSREYFHNLVLFHYGFLRKHKELVEKSINMQEWFWGDKESVDSRLFDAKKEGKFDPYKFIPKETLLPLKKFGHNFVDIRHPNVMKRWIEERKHLYDGEKENGNKRKK